MICFFQVTELACFPAFDSLARRRETQRLSFMSNDSVKVEAIFDHKLDVSIRNLETLTQIRETVLARLVEEGFPWNFQMSPEESFRYKKVKEVIQTLPEILHKVASEGVSHVQVLAIHDNDLSPLLHRVSWRKRIHYYNREFLLSPSHKLLWDLLEIELLQPFLRADRYTDFHYLYAKLP